MHVADWITLAVMAALVGAVVLGRRRGRQAFQAAIMAARAEGHASAVADASAAVAVHVNQLVSGTSGTNDHARSDHHDLDRADHHNLSPAAKYDLARHVIDNLDARDQLDSLAVYRALAVRGLLPVRESASPADGRGVGELLDGVQRRPLSLDGHDLRIPRSAVADHPSVSHVEPSWGVSGEAS